jgi:hypothetical protein
MITTILNRLAGLRKHREAPPPAALTLEEYEELFRVTGTYEYTYMVSPAIYAVGAKERIRELAMQLDGTLSITFQGIKSDAELLALIKALSVRWDVATSVTLGLIRSPRDVTLTFRRHLGNPAARKVRAA